MLLLHRPFLTASYTSPSIASSESLMACENAALNISVIIRQKQLLMSDPDSYAPLCLPTCFVYSMFQSSLVHLAIVIQNRHSLRQLESLKRSIALLQQYEKLVSARRACNILFMLVNMNHIHLDDIPDTLPQSPVSPELLYTQSEQQLDNLTFDEDDAQMPKSSWYMRMMNTSIVGGITEDLYQLLPNQEFETDSKNNMRIAPYYNTPQSYIPPSSSSASIYQPSNLNWNEWDAYLTQQHGSKPYSIP